MNKKQLKTFQEETQDMNFNELRAYLGINSPATELDTPSEEAAMTSQKKHPLFTLTIDFNATSETDTAQEQLAMAQAVIDAACAYAPPVVHVIANGSGQYFAELLQDSNPALVLKKVYRCTPCACSTSPQQKERMCFRLQ